MLTQLEKDTLKKELIDLKEQSTRIIKETNPKDSMKEVSGELSMYDNHPGDMGTALYEREKDFALHEHAESTLGKVEIALKAIEDGTYGKCDICDNEIPFERLEAVPYTLLCVEHAEIIEKSVEEDVKDDDDNPFESTMDGRARDYQNSFKVVAEMGTSDGPSDFTDTEKRTYFDEEREDNSRIDQIVGDSVTDNTDDA